MLMISACSSEDGDERMDAEKPQEEVLVEQPNLDLQLQKERESVMMQLGKGEMRAREETIDALVAIGELAIPALIKALADGKGHMGGDAGVVLAEIGEPAVPALVEALQNGDDFTRLNASLALGIMSEQTKGEATKTAVPALVAALKDENRGVRIHALMILDSMGEHAVDAVPALIEAWDDREIRVSVGYALAEVALHARDQVAIAVPKLIEGLSDKERVRFAASDALVAVGDPAVPALIRQLRVDDAEMCRQVVFVLGQIGEGARAAIPDLIDLLLNEPDLRPAVAPALGRIGDEAAVPALIQILESGDARLHSNVIGTLGAIGPPAKPPVPLLIEIVDAERHWHVRREAVIALGQIGAPAAIPVLIQSLVGKLLFSVEFELPPILKKPVMPAALQREFEKHGISPFGIAMLTPGKMWLTKDKERAYLIIKEEDLLNVYEDMGQEVRSGAAHALAQIGEPAILALIEVLNHPNTVASVQASAALRKIGTPEAIKAADEFWGNLGKR